MSKQVNEPASTYSTAFPKGIITSLYNKYANERPSIVIEVDTKADAENLATY